MSWPTLGGSQVRENVDQARDGTQQTQQRRDADDQFQHGEPAFQTHDLAAGGGLNRLGVLGARHAQMAQRNARQRRKGRRIIADQAGKLFGAAARLEPLDLMLDHRWQHALAPQGNETEQHKGHGHQRANSQRDHEPASVAEELDDRVERCGGEQWE